MEFSMDQIIAGFHGFVPPEEHPFPEHIEKAREIAGDGMVLLVNEENTLPIAPGKVALFGAGAAETVSSGTGPDYVPVPAVSVRDGLVNAGFTITSGSWINRFLAESEAHNSADTTLSFIDRFFYGRTVQIDEPLITDGEIREAREADTAVFVIRRNAGGYGARKAERGDYYLSEAEEQNLRKVAQAFERTIVVLNTGVMDANFLFEIPGITAAVLMGIAGMEGGNALANVLTGEKNPAGRLTETWAKHASDYPSYAARSGNEEDPHREDHTEDIFIGYRYFDTFGIEPLFPFGYGLSYTEFTIESVLTLVDWEKLTVRVLVTNVGKVPGREVVQVYVTAPEGRLTKPYRELRGFGKTRLLAPGEEENLTIEIPTFSLASYDEAKAAYVMEAGDYIVRIGRNINDTVPVASVTLDEEAVTVQLRNEMVPNHEINRLTAPKRPHEELPEEAVFLSLSAYDCETEEGARTASEDTERAANRKRFEDAPDTPNATLPDVKEGRVSMESFVKSLEPDVLIRLAAGTADETPYETKKRLNRAVRKVSGPGSSAELTSLFADSLGIPNFRMTDGPSGLRLSCCKTTCIPSEVLIAQTFDPALGEGAGEALGRELAFYHQSLVSGPGMNVRRDPLCTRVVDYFSEDPYLTGRMGTAFTKGVQKISGVGAAARHFGTGSQETWDAAVSERALREIFLAGFEMCVREADPVAVMTGGFLNGTPASSRFDLLTEVLRGEWGFKGVVMTDWNAGKAYPYGYHAGNDLATGGLYVGKQPDQDDVRASVCRVLRMIMRSVSWDLSFE